MKRMSITDLKQFTLTLLCYIERLEQSGFQRIRLPDDLFNRTTENMNCYFSQWLYIVQQIFHNNILFISTLRSDIIENSPEFCIVAFLDNNPWENVVAVSNIMNNSMLFQNYISDIWIDYINERIFYIEKAIEIPEKTMKIKNQHYSYYIVQNIKAPTIVIIGAIYTNYRIWNPLVNLLKNDYQIIIYQYNSSELNIDEMAEIIQEIILHENLNSFIIASWCSGFKTALKYINKYPNNVKDFIVISGNFSSIINRETVLTDFENSMITLAQLISTTKRNLNIKSILKVIMPNNVYKDIYSIKQIWGIPEYLKEIALQQFNDYDMFKNYLSMFVSYQNYNYIEDLQIATRNVRVINLVSEYDIISDYYNNSYLDKLIPNIETIILPMTSHWGLFENYYIYYEAIEKIMNSRSNINITMKNTYERGRI